MRLLPLLLLSGCCNFPHYTDADHSAIPRSGRIVWVWKFGQGFADQAQYGGTDVQNGVAVSRLAGEPPSFNDVCGLAQLGHEVSHAMGARHN